VRAAPCWQGLSRGDGASWGAFRCPRAFSTKVWTCATPSCGVERPIEGPKGGMEAPGEGSVTPGGTPGGYSHAALIQKVGGRVPGSQGWPLRC
jgi:hypothetical protein